MTQTGYEGTEEYPEPATFRLELYDKWPATSGVTARIFRNDRAVGMINLESEEEFLFLKRRMDGIFDPEVEDARGDPQETDRSNK